MKNAKKLAAVLLVVVMSFAIALPAAAATSTLTISGAKNNHTFSAYQIFAGTYNSTSGKLEGITWGSGFDTTKISNLISDLQSAYTSNTKVQALTATSGPAAIAAAFSSIASDTADAAKLADIFAKYTTGTPAQSTQTAAPYTITGLADGYYLVKDASTYTGTDDMISDFIMRIVKSETVAVKGDIPTVDKKVKAPGATAYEDGDSTPVNVQVGDILDYEIIGTLPSNYADYVKYQMVFMDTPDGDIALKTAAGTYGVYVDNGGTLTEAKSGFTASVTATGLTVTIADTKALKNASGTGISTTASSKIVVKYQAEVLSSTVPGTPDANSAKIEYSKDPNWDGTGTPDTGTTPPDEVKTVTQSFKFVKYDGANMKLLAGATFQIKNGSNVVQLVRISDTEYKVADSDDTNKVSTFTTTSTTAAITIKGLDADVEYTLHETAAPEGYNLLTSDKTFKVSAATTAASPVITSGVYTTTENVIGVANNSGTVLPETGGAGTVLLITVGAIVVMGTGIVLTAKKRLYNEG